MILEHTLNAIGLVMVITVTLASLTDSANPRLPKDFTELLNVAKRLESADFLLTDKSSAEVQTRRRDLIFLLARSSKNDFCKRQYESYVKLSNDYKIKAYNFIDESKNPNKNWFSFIKIGSPIQFMKLLGKSDPYLASVTERYETQAASGQLQQIDVDCDLIKLQVINLHSIMFLLQTDIKYLVLEDQQVLNQAIYEQLKADKFISSSNFYEVHELTKGQKDLLLRFYADRVNSAETKVSQAVDHFYNPGEYITARLLESCHAALQHHETWIDLEQGYNDVCSKSSSDPKEKFFPNQYKFDKFDNIFSFCYNFLEAL